MSSGHLGGVDLTRVRNDGMIGVDEIFGFGGKSCANCRQLFAFEPHYFTHPRFSFSFLSVGCCGLHQEGIRQEAQPDMVRIASQVQTWLYHEITLEWTLTRFPTLLLLLLLFPQPWTILTRAILGMLLLGVTLVVT